MKSDLDLVNINEKKNNFYNFKIKKKYEIVLNCNNNLFLSINLLRIISSMQVQRAFSKRRL